MPKKLNPNENFIKEAYNTYKSNESNISKTEKKEKYEEILDKS